LWDSLNRAHKKVLKAEIEEGGKNLRTAEILTRDNLASSTTRKTLKILDNRGILGEEEVIGAIRFRLEDPFKAAWLREVQAD
jgi:uncharacterized protein